MWKKLAAMIAGSVLASSCQTPMYKPIICEPGTALKGGRCQKVSQAVKDEHRTVPGTAASKPKYRSKVVGLPDVKPSVTQRPPTFTEPRSPSAKQDVYVPRAIGN